MTDLENYLFAHPKLNNTISKEELEAWKQNGPRSNTTYPFPSVGKTVAYLKNVITKPNIVVGDYTYYHDNNGADRFQDYNVIYHEEFVGDKLIIGKFCQIAMDVQFIMSASMHQMSGFSTYPFAIFNENWANSYPVNFPIPGDTLVGNDVWIGYKATILPGITIGDGAIIGSGSLVTKDVPPYTIIGGNPAKVIRHRFKEEIIKELQTIQWWNWPIETILQHLPEITGADIERLKNVQSN